ncbi:MAG: CoA transferase [Firmicutes bacterium]|nr:CoA transferase [Bacillota bacterium]
MSNRPYAGVRVLDLTQVLAGPYAGQLLGDLGADVIKVEQPVIGESAHKFPPYLNGESAYFLGFNRNKKSVTLNLKDPKALEIFYKLVETADVVLENYRPSVPPRLKIDYETLKAINPGIIYCSISGYGHGTTNQNKPAMDTVMQALSGAMSVIGEEGCPPYTMAFPVADVAAAYASLSGIGAALYEREKTGVGRWIDISLLDLMVTLQAYIGQTYLVTGKQPAKVGNSHPTNVPVGAFKCADGDYIQVQCITQPLYEKLVAVIERLVPEAKGLSEDPRFASAAERLAHKKEMMDLLAEIFAKKPSMDWVNEASNEIAVAHVNDIGQALNESSLIERHMIVDMEHPVAGKYKTIGNPLKMGQDEIYNCPPTIGQHNDEILASLGYSKEDIEALRESKTI